VGRYDWKIPYWGLLADVLKTRGGYLALVVVPGAAIIVFEMVRLYRELDSSGRDQTAPREEVVEFEVVARRGRA
ncbi:MAG TPA: hypothetical protein VI997_09735, partial [Candidatus Thermoplasmatota archaeon]|nr:hypothetical protein [Candidatus Thermoplasmatota archaeon]